MIEKKADGFLGQLSVVIPSNILLKIEKNYLINSLFVTDIGYYPRAKFHFRERKTGIDQNILIYVVEGKGYINLDSHVHTLSPNSFFVIPAFKPHKYYADQKTPWGIFWVHYKGEKSVTIPIETEKVLLVKYEVSDKTDKRVELFKEIINILLLGYSQENLEYANMSLWYLMANFVYGEQFNNKDILPSNDPVSKSILFMKENISVNLSLPGIAEKSGYSVSHFSKIFTQRTKQSPLEYFKHLRMQRACDLLDHSELRIKEIGNDLGFNDVYHFSRVFKEIMSISPQFYRKRSQKTDP